jgi:hypothetical protein
VLWFTLQHANKIEILFGVSAWIRVVQPLEKSVPTIHPVALFKD